MLVTHIYVWHIVIQNNSKQLKLMVNNELIKVDEWMHLNKLSMNYAKSMFFLTGKLFNKVEEEKGISKFTLIMLCYIG